MSTYDHTTPEVEYRDIEGFPGYRVGSDGTVWTCRKRASDGRRIWWEMSDEWVLMKPQPRGGYPRAALRRDGKAYEKMVSHLVLEAFVGPRPEGMFACHDPDPNPSNNRTDNLRWDTQKENVADYERWRKKNGVAKPRNHRVGEDSHFAKRTADDIREIRRLIDEKVPYKVICSMFGIPRENYLCKIKKRQIWADV